MKCKYPHDLDLFPLPLTSGWRALFTMWMEKMFGELFARGMLGRRWCEGYNEHTKHTNSYVSGA